ncbi:MAG: nodulation protein NfeD [Gammaproteobacteria bacterium]|nr:nodulation protein NfeD [Gammaproteobacteria bacterium]
MTRGVAMRMTSRFVRLMLLFVIFCYGIPANSEESPDAPPAGAIWLLQIDDAIGPAISDYIVRGLQRAQMQQAELVVIEMDTPGGLDTSMREIIQAIIASKVPVVTYVHPGGARAASAGTYILYASHIAAMTPATNLGAATPVQIGVPSIPIGNPEDEEDNQGPTPTTMDMKMVNDAIAFIRGLAELRGRNADWAESAVREAASLSAQQALQENVIDVIAADLDELLLELDGYVLVIESEEYVLNTQGRYIHAEDQDWRTEFLKVITNPNLVLILGMIGFYGIILEFYNPGVGVPGVVGVICLLLAGYGLQMLPVNYAGLALIILGIALMVAEAMAPSFGIFGFGGIVSFLIGSIILIDTDFGAFQIGLPVIAATGLISLGFIFITISLAMKIRKKDIVTGIQTMIGMVGVAMDEFEVEGMVKIRGELWNATSESPLSKGDQVKVVDVSGLRLKVEKGDQVNE